MPAGKSRFPSPHLSAFPTTFPAEGLQVGRDLAGNVGDYNSPFPFTGKISQVTIDLLPAQ